jgi:exoribonuclease R
MSLVHVKDALRGPWFLDGVQQEGLPPGVLHGDSLDGDRIERGAHGPIVGIVDFLNRTRYGFSSHGVPQYLFHPLDKRFPPMIVGSKAAPTVNQWGIITTKDMVWNTAKSKWPSVGLQQLLGPVGNPEIEVAARLRQYLRQVPRTKIAVDDASLSNTLPPVEEWETCFNIDPAGCRDVDDILAWRKQGDNLEFSIGIALVAPAVPTDSPLDLKARALGQTLYREGVVVEPMLPAALSEGSLSLLADGKPRGVLAAVWTLYEDEREVKGPEWRVFSVVNKATYTYESVLVHELSHSIPIYLKQILRKDVGSDPHHWIEAAMIAYNHAAAQTLAAAGQGILRCHQTCKRQTCHLAMSDDKSSIASCKAGCHKGLKSAEWSDLASQTGCAELAFLGFAAGEYTAVEENVGHAGLGLDLYCHASSPLRRYADLENQRVLLALLDSHLDSQHLNSLPKHLNERAKAAKQFERDVWFLTHLSSEHLTTAEGFLISSQASMDTRKYKVYVPAWRRMITVRSDTPDFQQLAPATPVQITAFWDVRQVRNPFVFRIQPIVSTM